MNVIRLIAKDVVLHRWFLAPLVLLEVAGYYAYAVQMPSHIPGVAFGLLHGVALIGDFLICYRTMVAEEKNRALLFVKSLPVSTAEIVIAKFGANLLLVTLNAALLLTLWGAGQNAGWIHVRPALTAGLLVTGLTAHAFNSAFLVAVSLVFTSERAIWVLFPAIFGVMTVMVNFRRIVAALHLEPVVALLRQHHSLGLCAIWMTVAALAVASCWILERKKVFS
jgi:hypothetical protein